MKVVAIIPARFASTRLPGKPLLDRTGKTLIQHVVENARKAGRLEQVVVATDDDRILRAVRAFGGQAVMTSDKHRCGTDRLAEAAEILKLADDDVVVNVQGDEPDMPPAAIDDLVELITNSQAPMATLCTPISADEARNPNRVKAVLAQDGSALYFSRAAIPFDRDGSRQPSSLSARRPSLAAAQDSGRVEHLLHLGIYAYRAGFLRHFTKLPPTPAEDAEKLEQLRALEHGYKIVAAVIDYAGGGIDTPEDYEAFVKRLEAKERS